MPVMNETRDFPPLVNLIDRPVSQVAEDPRANLALRRILANLNDPNGVISAFGSFIADK